MSIWWLIFPGMKKVWNGTHLNPSRYAFKFYFMTSLQDKYKDDRETVRKKKSEVTITYQKPLCETWLNYTLNKHKSVKSNKVIIKNVIKIISNENQNIKNAWSNWTRYVKILSIWTVARGCYLTGKHAC